VSTGGLAALAVKISLRKNDTSQFQNPTNGENDHDHTDKVAMGKERDKKETEGPAV
jgi:hypothetical protein